MINTTKLLLVRHGQSQANLETRFAGNFNMPLTALGYQQAECTAEFIASNYNVDAVYCSDLQRAFDTGRAVAVKLRLPAKAEASLREISAGQWEGVTFDVLARDFPEDYSVWLHDIGNSRPTGGESVAELAERIDDALRHICKENPGKTVVVATHATPIRVMQCLLSGQTLSHMKNIPWVANASVTELFYDNSSFRLGKVAQDEHLKDLKTGLPANV